MRVSCLVTTAVLLFPACSNSNGPSLTYEEVNRQADQVVRGEIPARHDGPADTRPDCGKCAWDRTCSPDGECVPYGCESSKDCPAGDLVCDQDTGECVQCIGPEDCPDELFCGADHRCHETHFCESDKECKDYDLVCDKDAGKCVECLTVVECTDGEYCEQGFCLAAACEVGASKCVGNTVHGCPEGKSWTVAQACTDKEYCEEGECKDLACEPGAGWCQGDIYALCAADGKSVKLEEDCAATGKHCTSLGCGDCAPQCVGKECGDDGCGGNCGACSQDENCVAGECVAKCGDATCSAAEGESCESCPTDCGECPGACDPACDADREECLEAVTGEWVCAAKPVTIPAGEFWMGCNNCEGSEVMEESCKKQEHPYHLVYLDEYAIGRTEVTANQLLSCLSLGGCPSSKAEENECYGVQYAAWTWKEEGLGDHPANCVAKSQAKEYCAWLGQTLCTEAQWEKGARGGCEENGGASKCKNQSRKYPWGNEQPACSLTVFWSCEGATKSACSASPAGDSPYGLCDMAGNLYEWVLDSYAADFYCSGDDACTEPTENCSSCPQCGTWPGAPEPWSNPFFELGGALPIARGGSFTHWGDDSVSVSRRAPTSAVRSVNAGFRCCYAK